MKLSEGLPAYPPTTDFAVQREVMRKEAQDALAHAAVRMKAQYDQTHKPLRLTPGDLVFVRLHRGYNMPDGSVSQRSQLMRV
jgi:hypothetical protein